MSKNEKRIVLNKVVVMIMETIFTILLLVGTLVLLAEEEYFCSILAGVGVLASIAMILTDYNTLEIWLDTVEDNSETKEDNK